MTDFAIAFDLINSAVPSSPIQAGGEYEGKDSTQEKQSSFELPSGKHGLFSMFTSLKFTLKHLELNTMQTRLSRIF